MSKTYRGGRIVLGREYSWKRENDVITLHFDGDTDGIKMPGEIPIENLTTETILAFVAAWYQGYAKGESVGLRVGERYGYEKGCNDAREAYGNDEP